MIITISGKAGSGKSTIAKILAEKLELKHYSAGDFRRLKAKELGMTIEQYNKKGEKDFSTDKQADDWQTEIGKTQNNFIIDGRTSYHFIPNSVKIFFDVSPEKGAERIIKDSSNRPEEQFSSISEAMIEWENRNKSDSKRYKQYYNIDPYANLQKQYDLVLDTSNLTIEEVVKKVLEFVQNKA